MANEELDEPNKEKIFAEISKRVADVRGRIDDAAKRSGRSGSDVLLVGVSKYAEPTDGVVEGFLRSGLFDLGENRPQRLLEKTSVWNETSYWKGTSSQTFLSAVDRKNGLSDETLRWHFIGSLQRNKIRRVLPYVSLIHSVDSWKLLEAIDRILGEEENSTEFSFPKKVSALLEVHISEDATKQGFTPEEILDVLPKTMELKHIDVRGLMGMGGLTATPDETRRQFATLRKTLEKCRDSFPEFVGLKELSMGMSGDFETAIEEGATIVRVGSILYPESK